VVKNAMLRATAVAVRTVNILKRPLRIA
jgi:hypothetical protein